MKCRSCEETIPSKFSHSIKTNTCPFCGEEIMEPALQNILKNLQTIMKDGELYMIEIEEWLASNYSLRKGGTKQSTVLSGGGDDESFDEESIRKQTEAAKQAIDFQKRAGIKPGNIKSLVEKIQSGGGAAHPSEFVGVDEDYGEIDMSNEVSLDPLSSNDAGQMAVAMNQGLATNQDDVLKNYYEIEKLKKLQRQQPAGGGKFSRGE